MTIAEKQRELMAALKGLRTAQDRFAYLVQRGRAQAPLPTEFKTEAHRVAGCLAKVWFAAKFHEGRCYFETDSDSAIVKGIAAVLCEFYSGQTPEEIVGTDPAFLEPAGINQHLTPNRRNSLTRIWEMIRGFADQQRPA